VVSSYIPSLSALTKARKDWKPTIREDISGLLVSESSPGRGYAPILNVDAETRAVLDSCAGTGARFVSGADEAWTVSAIISALEKGDVNILHMACHGVQSPRPLESSFVLKDGNLAIQDLMRLDLRRAAFAFLSACQTAQGDQSHPDQAVHLAASMLFCGFRSVIGTMW
jgi:CHAT domain-containing protein